MDDPFIGPVRELECVVSSGTVMDPTPIRSTLGSAPSATMERCVAVAAMTDFVTNSDADVTVSAFFLVEPQARTLGNFKAIASHRAVRGCKTTR